MDTFWEIFKREAEAAQLPSQRGIVLNTEYAVYEYDLELSIRPEAQ